MRKNGGPEFECLWFSPASSTTKTGRHDIAESDVKHKKSIKIMKCKTVQSDVR
jgi:hypothetical protein